MTKISKYGLPPCDFKHFVYRHIRDDKNEPFYIGIGTVSKSGLYNRAFSKQRNIVWKRVAQKTTYRVEIIYETDYYEDGIQKEIEFIKLYGRYDKGLGTLCNLTDGGDGNTGYIISDYTRGLFRKRQLGKKLPNETVKNMSIAQKNRYKINGVSPKAKTIYQYTIDGLFLKEWPSINHASKELKCSGPAIKRGVDKLNKYAQGYLWSYSKVDLLVSEGKFYLHSKIAKTDMEGNIIKIFKNISLVVSEDFTNLTGKNIVSDICKGKRDSFNNFKYKYYVEGGL